ncbi:hypothetical protein CC207_07980 [Pseudomonas sp. DrBHI1]|nr:hypothetical protein AXZ07_17450 [Pseudomonas mosselii]OWQ36766.1 hypothetical protein CC207_07980 [Pseudomonas sp. DrBHI1]
MVAGCRAIFQGQRMGRPEAIAMQALSRIEPAPTVPHQSSGMRICCGGRLADDDASTVNTS